MTSARPFYSPPANCQVPELGEKWAFILGRRTEGYFVEVGAYDGENFSNTSCLADAGWAGLYVEPIEEFAEKCRARHSGNSRVSVLNCAASDAAGAAQIFLGDTLTTLVGDQVADYAKIDWAKNLHRGESREIKTERLDVLLEEAKAPIGFDVLVVDVEGAEEKVINGFDIARWRPKVILIELEDEHPDFRENTRVVNSVTAIRQKIELAGYTLYFKDHINSMYLRADVHARIGKKEPRLSPQPKVAIGLPTYNRVDMLKEAVQSIQRQTFQDFELIISDNCSPDPQVAEACIDWAEGDSKITYIRQLTNIGATGNILAVLGKTNAPLFMWASDDDLWDEKFLDKAVRALDADSSISAWMCHLRVIDTTGAVVREIPNLSRYSSTDQKMMDLARFIADPECLGKGNLFYAVYKRSQLDSIVQKVTPYFHDWGPDMIFLYAFLCRANMKVDPDIYFCKRLAPQEVGFIPVDPRQHIVPWEHAGKYYWTLVEISRNTPYFLFTYLAVRARYVYDVLYWRLKLKRHAPWRPPRSAPQIAQPVPKATQPGPQAAQPGPPAEHVAPGSGRPDPDLLAATKKRFIEEFREGHYVRHNQRRQEHLASLGLRIEGRSVLELGAGIGDHTTFFIDRNCSICVSDGRPELFEIIRERYSWMRTELLDLENPDPKFQDAYEIVYAYGLLYHLNNPACALDTMAKWCGDMLLLETAVSANDNAGENLVFEHKEFGSQSVSGTGCRPSRLWVFEYLKRLFPYVYTTKTQPWHPEFPLDWNNIPPDAAMIRAVFVASRTPLDLPTLTPKLPRKQVRH